MAGKIFINYRRDDAIAIAGLLGRDRSSGAVISQADRAFGLATDSLIALYRNLERGFSDLPFISITPFLIFLWGCR